MRTVKRGGIYKEFPNLEQIEMFIETFNAGWSLPMCLSKSRMSRTQYKAWLKTRPDIDARVWAYKKSINTHKNPNLNALPAILPGEPKVSPPPRPKPKPAPIAVQDAPLPVGARPINP